MNTTVGRHILARLRQAGVSHIFGVPGDFALGLFDTIMNSNMEYVGTCNELNAGYAADGYARMRGLGALAVTFAVGELSALNAITGAYAEYVPVVVLSGMPLVREIREQPLLHHTFGDYMKPFKMFQMVTCDGAVLLDPRTAPQEIDRVIASALREKRPVYLGVPADMVNAPCAAPPFGPLMLPIPRGPAYEPTLAEAVGEAANLLNRSQYPIIVADGLVLRHQAERELRALVDSTGYPIACLMMGKGAVDEDHPQYIGLYGGLKSREYVRNRIEQADCVMLVGALMSDFNTGSFTVKIPKERCIQVDPRKTLIRHHVYEDLDMQDVLTALKGQLARRDPRDMNILPASQSCTHRPGVGGQRHVGAEGGGQLTVKYIFDRLASSLPENVILIADSGQCMSAAAETKLPRGGAFVGQVYYSSIGYALPATLGVCLAAPHRPVILCIGDGAFQVTAQELSTVLRYGASPKVILLNNDGYLIERLIQDGRFNDLAPWRYHELPRVFAPLSAPRSFDALTETDFDRAISLAGFESDGAFAFVEVHTDRWDYSDTLKSAATAMAARVNATPMQPAPALPTRPHGAGITA